MKLGIAIFPADYAIRPDELGRAVEERGFESLFFTDHTHIPATPATRELMQQQHGGVLPHFTHNHDPFVALAYAAAATQTLRLGTGVLLVPQREPIATAKTLATLDALSHGRLLIGIGVGRSSTSECGRCARSELTSKRSSTAATWTSTRSGPGPSPRSNHIHPSSSAAPAKASSAACSPTATNGCRTPACRSSSSEGGSGNSKTPHGPQGARPASPSPCKARIPTPAHWSGCALRATAGSEEVLRFLDDVTPLVDATEAD
jgi:hypothetical protein